MSHSKRRAASPAARDAVQLGQDALQRESQGSSSPVLSPAAPTAWQEPRTAGRPPCAGQSTAGPESPPGARTAPKPAPSARAAPTPPTGAPAGCELPPSVPPGSAPPPRAGSLQGAGRGQKPQQLRGPELAVRLPPVRIRKGRRSLPPAGPGFSDRRLHP